MKLPTARTLAEAAARNQLNAQRIGRMKTSGMLYKAELMGLKLGKPYDKFR